MLQTSTTYAKHNSKYIKQFTADHLYTEDACTTDMTVSYRQLG